MGDEKKQQEKIVFMETADFSGCVDLNRYDRVFVLVDENTQEYCYPLLQQQGVLPDQVLVITGPQGEPMKTLTSAMALWETLTEKGATRHSCLLVLGGGLLCDLGAFTASLFKRGMDFMLIPTTLLAQVDASIGGKNGVNFYHIKNHIGCFRLPAQVIIHPAFLSTLPRRIFLSGISEMLKHGLIADYGYFQSLVSLPEFTPEALTPFILSSVQIKLKITKVDPQEKNYRKALNFGHSIGHALESWSNEEGKTTLLHGEAVALGLLAELWLSGQCLGMSPEPEAELKRVLPRLVPDFSFSPSDLDALLWYVFQDKKNVADDIYMVLLKNPEETVPAFRVEKEWVSKAFLYLSHYITTEKKDERVASNNSE